jgi:hypothetical protein
MIEIVHYDGLCIPISKLRDAFNKGLTINDYVYSLILENEHFKVALNKSKKREKKLLKKLKKIKLMYESVGRE